MRKRCQFCRRHFFSRWRNTPAVCEGCAPCALVCTHCLQIVAVERDPMQLTLFSADEMVRRQRWSVAALLDRFPARHFATKPETIKASETDWYAERDDRRGILARANSRVM